MKPTITLGETDMLLVVDVQNDFCPGGALEVPRGDEIVPTVNRLAGLGLPVVLTQDWHTPRHLSFATAHEGRQPYDTVMLPYGRQILWPEHCVAGTRGAAFHPDLDVARADMILRKGFRPDVDSYSAFRENDRVTPTGLAGYLRDRGMTRLILCGLALDFCVKWSALDARREGFEAVVLEDACRAIDLDGSLRRARNEMRDAGVVLSTSDAVVATGTAAV